jgi:hypothetical protein
LYFLDHNPCTNQIDQVNKREYDPKHKSYYACFHDAYHEYKLPKFVTEEIDKDQRKKAIQFTKIRFNEADNSDGSSECEEKTLISISKIKK